MSLANRRRNSDKEEIARLTSEQASEQAAVLAAIPNPLVRNITGNVTGNLTGNVTGNVSGTAGAASEATGDLLAEINARPKWLDLGVIEVADLLTGRLALYATGAGEFVSGLRYGADNVEYVDSGCIAFEIGAAQVAADTTSSFVFAGIGAGGGDFSDSLEIEVKYGDASVTGGTEGVASAIPQSGTLTATIAAGDTSSQACSARVLETPGWEAEHVYTADVAIIEAGHVWMNDGGTSDVLASKPDFAGNIAGTVGDNGMTWTDFGAVPTTGSAHVFIEVVTPIAYP